MSKDNSEIEIPDGMVVVSGPYRNFTNDLLPQDIQVLKMYPNAVISSKQDGTGVLKVIFVPAEDVEEYEAFIAVCIAQLKKIENVALRNAIAQRHSINLILLK